MKINCEHVNYIIGIIIVIIVVTLIYLFIRAFLIKKKNKTHYVKINGRIDNEHEDMLNAIDTLYDACDKHWKTEDEYYELGKKNMPPNHQDVSAEWEMHRQDHVNLLEQIRQMKENIITHIKTKDKKHFHFLIK
jgi:hypothetical protein